MLIGWLLCYPTPQCHTQIIHTRLHLILVSRSRPTPPAHKETSTYRQYIPQYLLCPFDIHFFCPLQYCLMSTNVYVQLFSYLPWIVWNLSILISYHLLDWTTGAFVFPLVVAFDLWKQNVIYCHILQYESLPKTWHAPYTPSGTKRGGIHRRDSTYGRE